MFNMCLFCLFVNYSYIPCSQSPQSPFSRVEQTTPNVIRMRLGSNGVDTSCFCDPIKRDWCRKYDCAPRKCYHRMRPIGDTSEREGTAAQRRVGVWPASKTLARRRPNAGLMLRICRATPRGSRGFSGLRIGTNEGLIIGREIAYPGTPGCVTGAQGSHGCTRSIITWVSPCIHIRILQAHTFTPFRVRTRTHVVRQ